MGTYALSDLTRLTGSKDKPTLELKKLFLGIVDFFMLDWNASLTDEVARLAYAEYHWVTLAEWKLFEHRVKTSAFGKQYHKLSPAELMGHIATFSQELQDARAGLDRKTVSSDVAAQDAKREAERWVLKYDPILCCHYWQDTFVSASRFKGLAIEVERLAADQRETRKREAQEYIDAKRAYQDYKDREHCKATGQDYNAYMEAKTIERREQIDSYLKGKHAD